MQDHAAASTCSLQWQTRLFELDLTALAAKHSMATPLHLIAVDVHLFSIQVSSELAAQHSTPSPEAVAKGSQPAGKPAVALIGALALSSEPVPVIKVTNARVCGAGAPDVVHSDGTVSFAITWDVQGARRPA